MLKSLGIGYRARLLISGEEFVIDGIRKNKVYLVFLANDASDNSKKKILDKAKSGSNGRYVAVNLNNYHTIEFRLFRGTLKLNTFIATLQMVETICNAAFSMSEEELMAGANKWELSHGGISG